MSRTVKGRKREKLDLLIANANEVVTLSSEDQKPRTGTQMREIGIIRDGGLAIKDGRIVAVGRTTEITKTFKAENTISANGDRKSVV